MPVLHARRSLLLLTVSVLTVLLVAGLLLRRQVNHALLSTSAQVRQAHEIPFSLGPLRPTANPGFVAVAGRPAFHSGAYLGHNLFLASPDRLVQLAQDGQQLRELRVGVDLPPSPIVAMAVGRVHGSAATQLLLATAGSGVLLLHGGSGSLDQLLPHAPELRDVTALVVLPGGDLLLGTRRSGVLRFDGGHLSLFRPEYRALAITSLVSSPDGVWVGTQADGLWLTRGGVTQHLQAELPDAYIEALAASGRQLFAATPNGVAAFTAAKYTRTLAPGRFARSLAVDGNDLVVSFFEGGTGTIPLDARHPRIAAFAGQEDERTEQLFSADGTVYAVRPAEVLRRERSAWVPVLRLPGPGLTDGNLAALAFAPDGNLWVGYFDHGVDVVPAGPGDVQHQESDQLFCINRLAVDPVRKTMVAATANGLVLFDHRGVPRQILGSRDGLISEHVTDVAWLTSPAGNTMALATPAGLSFVSSAGVDSLYAFQGLVNNHVYSVAVLPDGGLLAGTLGGLSFLQNGSVRRNLTTGNSGLRHNWISAIAPLPAFAGQGTVVGTYGGGLMHLAPSGQVTAMPGAPSGLVINPNALLTTANHIVAGSLGDGLWVLGRASGQWHQITGGLPSLNVTALAWRNGELYVGTDNGLVHIAEAQLPA